MAESVEQAGSNPYVTFESLVGQYAAIRNANVGKSLTPEQNDKLEDLMRQMVDVTADGFTATPQNERLKFISSFRHDHLEMHEGVFPRGRQGLFLDRLMVRVAEKIENPQLPQ